MLGTCRGHRGLLGTVGAHWGTPAGGGRGRDGDVTFSFFQTAAPHSRMSAAVTRSCLPAGVSRNVPRMSSECPQGVPAVSPSAMDPREVRQSRRRDREKTEGTWRVAGRDGGFKADRKAWEEERR